MTQPKRAEVNESPEGLIFLPKTVRGLENFKLELMLGRGVARGRSLAELEELYEAANKELDSVRSLMIHAGHIAIASGM